MPSGAATVTAKRGPGNQVTAMPHGNIKKFEVDIERRIFKIDDRDFDLAGVTTFTVTISAGNFTLTIS
jgi:hypothetical protein